MEKKDINTLTAAIRFLNNEPKILFDPYPHYPAEIMALLELLPPDSAYPFHYDLIKDKAISELDRDDIATYFTFILRGERFCDGHIAVYVESGDLLALAEQLARVEGVNVRNEEAN